ncbi:Asp-tRNA(Asn)/Glu-tRNA(Gln) amidotransferase subunit GatB [Mycoplasmoides alvi]|uniref:Asp-tRNA(Asn)/Glu-tRNA(Gln) amidotransferase subunit GatB n=1 Tax=Mycoplasmoides alvi TaxID=78580 RepID=UPI00051BA671|nr:Asp-tRNA(Asn)/Glu-tRNA(Gln) amidotransferase subunit GatB [Mycoplasmoides alvi]
MFNFETVIGIEVHVALNTLTKMFSSALNNHDANPNVNLHINDLGLPGTMPQPNKAAVKKALILAKALNMENVDYLLRFDRKNYFYQDLPKGFQITQQYHPFAQNGYLEVFSDKKKYQFKIQRFHLEEDTAKQFNINNHLFLDYNRAGAPLIEIVTDPIFHNAEEVKLYLTTLRHILIHNDISDAKMEAGSMRADINLSVRPVGSDKFGTRVEIKNVNSLNNIERAIKYETNRQIESLLLGKPIIQSTMHYDDVTNKTIYMRDKSNDIDYRYMREPNIIQIQLDKIWVDSIYSDNKIVYPIEIASQLQSVGIETQKINLLLDDIALLKAFNYVAEKTKNFKETSKWLLVELLGILNENNYTFEKNVTVDDLDNIVEMIMLLENQKINGKQAKVILEHTYKTKKKPSFLIVDLKMEQITDLNKLRSLLEPIILNNEIKIQKDYKNRPERVESMILGLLMKATNGQANPSLASQIMREMLQKYVQ